MEIGADRLREALNGDREFRIHARYWNTQFRIVTDTQTLLVKLVDGSVATVDPGATRLTAGTSNLPEPMSNGPRCWHRCRHRFSRTTTARCCTTASG